MFGNDENSAKFFVDAVISHCTEKLTLADIDSFPVADIDQNFVSIILDELHSREVAKTTTNLFQKTCTDKLSIALPSRALLASEDLDYDDLCTKSLKYLQSVQYHGYVHSDYRCTWQWCAFFNVSFS
ncbi:MAG: hypothetical protein ACLR6B_03745 [Blautia sp.]